MDFQGVSLLLMKLLYYSGSLKVSSYSLTRVFGLMLFSMKVDSLDDELDEIRRVSVVMVVNSDTLDEMLGIKEDSVMMSVKLLLMVDFCSVIINHQ